VLRGRERPPIPPERGGAPPPDARDAPLVALAEALVRARTLEAGLAYELVASRADLQRVVTFAGRGGEEPDVRTLTGWRRELVGDELLSLLAGRGAVGVQDGAVHVVA
jgi:ribonuclease D